MSPEAYYLRHFMCYDKIKLRREGYEKITILLCIIALCICLVIHLTDPWWLYDGYVQEGSFFYSMHKYRNICCVSHGMWDGNSETMEAVIPDEVDGHRVTIWGNIDPDPFLINMNDISFTCGEEMVPENAIIVPRYLKITLGKNVKEIRDIVMKDFYKSEKEPAVYYQILVEIECSEENSWYYTEGGKLYQKSDSALVDVFCYRADYPCYA